MMWQRRVGQFCDFAGVRIWERDSICFDMNIGDYIEAVHADDFGAAIGQIAVCGPGRVHHAARRLRGEMPASECANELLPWAGWRCASVSWMTNLSSWSRCWKRY